MDMMSSIAAGAMSMKQAQVAQQYSVSLAKKAMDSTEQQALGELAMLPDVGQMQQAVSKGHYIDVLV